jgi:hypothetical protein
MPDQSYDWERTVYGDVHEQIQRDAPKPLGKRVVLTTYVDANLNHDLVTGRLVIGVLHFVNQTPVHWFTKKQPTVEMATYGSEFIAAKLAVEQIMAMRITLQYLGVEVHGATCLFGDNGSVVTSSLVPDSPLQKRHQALAYHYTSEAIASKALDFCHLPGDLNPADILSNIGVTHRCGLCSGPSCSGQVILPTSWWKLLPNLNRRGAKSVRFQWGLTPILRRISRQRSHQ